MSNTSLPAEERRQQIRAFRRRWEEPPQEKPIPTQPPAKKLRLEVHSAQNDGKVAGAEDRLNDVTSVLETEAGPVKTLAQQVADLQASSDQSKQQISHYADQNDALKKEIASLKAKEAKATKTLDEQKKSHAEESKGKDRVISSARKVMIRQAVKLKRANNQIGILKGRVIGKTHQAESYAQVVAEARKFVGIDPERSKKSGVEQLLNLLQAVKETEHRPGLRKLPFKNAAGRAKLLELKAKDKAQGSKDDPVAIA